MWVPPKHNFVPKLMQTSYSVQTRWDPTHKNITSEYKLKLIRTKTAFVCLDVASVGLTATAVAWQ